MDKISDLPTYIDMVFIIINDHILETTYNRQVDIDRQTETRREGNRETYE